MKKTLYIRIDSSPLPEEVEEVIYFDCNLENYFCSHLGRVLCHELKAKDGTPYYRLFQPGALVADYKKVEPDKYCGIIQQWENVLGELLHEKPDATEKYTFTLAKEYKDWLCYHDNECYREVGKFLNDGVTLSAEELYNDVISVLCQRLKRYLLMNKENIDCVVFSDASIRSSSIIVKELQLISSYDFLFRNEWEQMMTLKNDQKKVTFPIQELFIPPKSMTLSELKDLEYEIDEYSEENVVLMRITYSLKYNKEEQLNSICLYTDSNGNDMFPLWAQLGFDWYLSYNEVSNLFTQLGFTVSDISERYKGSVDYGTECVACLSIISNDQRIKLMAKFSYYINKFTKDARNTLYSIELEM